MAEYLPTAGLSKFGRSEKFSGAELPASAVSTMRYHKSYCQRLTPIAAMARKRLNDVLGKLRLSDLLDAPGPATTLIFQVCSMQAANCGHKAQQHIRGELIRLTEELDRRHSIGTLNLQNQPKFREALMEGALHLSYTRQGSTKAMQNLGGLLHDLLKRWSDLSETAWASLEAFVHELPAAASRGFWKPLYFARAQAEKPRPH